MHASIITIVAENALIYVICMFVSFYLHEQNEVKWIYLYTMSIGLSNFSSNHNDQILHNDKTKADKAKNKKNFDWQKAFLRLNNSSGEYLDLDESPVNL